jgi:hypothetical protein
MGLLISELFSDDPRLEKCLTSDPHHVKLGDRGSYVAKIQYAVLVLEGGQINGEELRKEHYGPTTAKRVLAYKSRRRIINFTYQQAPDDIVGKMTIRFLDLEIAAFEARERFRSIQPKRFR